MDANNKHTPGPWVITVRDNNEFKYTPRLEVGPAVVHYCAGYHSLEQDAEFKATAIANARLIAAAPELLAALKKAQAILFLRTTEKDDEAMEALVKINAAIAKATGGNEE